MSNNCFHDCRSQCSIMLMHFLKPAQWFLVEWIVASSEHFFWTWMRHKPFWYQCSPEAMVCCFGWNVTHSSAYGCSVPTEFLSVKVYNFLYKSALNSFKQRKVKLSRIHDMIALTSRICRNQRNIMCILMNLSRLLFDVIELLVREGKRFFELFQFLDHTEQQKCVSRYIWKRMSIDQNTNFSIYYNT